jgi:hypothetical protein
VAYDFNRRKDVGGIGFGRLHPEGEFREFLLSQSQIGIGSDL